MCVLSKKKALMCLTGSESPVVIVLSGFKVSITFCFACRCFDHTLKHSMYGDTFSVAGRDIPIVRRVIKERSRDSAYIRELWLMIIFMMMQNHYTVIMKSSIRKVFNQDTGNEKKKDWIINKFI
ncbi:unnamed protein product [Brassica rapa subsp. narinosa]